MKAMQARQSGVPGAKVVLEQFHLALLVLCFALSLDNQLQSSLKGALRPR